MQTLIFVLLIFLGANLINAITGFAGVLLSMPGTILLLGAENARVICTVSYWVSSFILAVLTWRQADRHEVVKLSGLILPGIALGVVLFYQLDLTLLLYIYGAMIVIVALKQILLKPKNRPVGRGMTVLIMLGAGIMQGLFVSGGALVVIYAVQRFRDKEVFRATLTMLWVVLNTVLLVQEAASGAINAHNLFLSALVCVPALLGIYVGNKLMKYLSGRAFFALANILLLLSGLSCFI